MLYILLEPAMFLQFQFFFQQKAERHVLFLAEISFGNQYVWKLQLFIYF